MKNIYSLLVGFFALNYAYAQDCDCDHTIPLAMSYFDGGTVSPGQTVCITAGLRSNLRIKQLNGLPDNPIKIVNCGGEVIINAPYSSHGLMIDGCSYFQFTGTGDDSENGFRLQGIGGNGIVVRNLSHHFEIDHVQIEEVGDIALLLRDNPNCELTANEGYFIQEDVYIHDLLINECNGGISVGHPRFREGLYEPFCGALFPYPVENLTIENVTIEQVNDGNAISLYGCTGVVRASRISHTEGVGILLKNECHVSLEQNEILNTARYGTAVEGGGAHQFYNNIYLNNGDFGFGAVWIEFKVVAGMDYENVLMFEHNTIVNSGSYNLGIDHAEAVSSSSYIRNNIFCEPLAYGEEMGPFFPYYFGEADPLIIIDHNLISDSRYELDFVDPEGENFQLIHSSTAINQGVETDLEVDFMDSPRNLAGSPDIGAFEYVPEPRSYFGSIQLVGLYVDDFKNILGDEEAETELLEYARANGFNYLLLYNLSYIHGNLYDLTDPDEAIVLANFIERAKKEYGIAQMGAVGEKNASFDKIEVFNELFGDSWYQKFDVLNLEFEFWTDMASAVFSYYCESYLSPGGYPCNNDGAFDFYSDELEMIDTRAHEMGIISEIYLGYTSDDQMIELAERSDRILLHHYRTSDTYGDGSSIYNYHVNRIRAIGLSERKPAVMPIFSSRAYHMGPWLITHSLHQPMDTWLNGLDGYYEDESEGVSELPIAGYQWYRYTSFLDLLEGFYMPESTPAFDHSNGSSIQTNLLNIKNVLVVQNNNFNAINSGFCEIYSVTGAMIFSANWEGINQEFDLSHLPVGIYFLCLRDNDEILHSEKISLN